MLLYEHGYVFVLLYSAQIQKLKHSVSKGEKKKKKEITEQIAQLEADLDKKHEQELKELQEGKTKVHIYITCTLV